MTILSDAPAGANPNGLDHRVLLGPDDERPDGTCELPLHLFVEACTWRLRGLVGGLHNGRAAEMALKLAATTVRLLELPHWDPECGAEPTWYYGKPPGPRYGSWAIWAAGDASFERGLLTGKRGKQLARSASPHHRGRTEKAQAARRERLVGPKSKRARRMAGRRKIDAGVAIGIWLEDGLLTCARGLGARRNASGRIDTILVPTGWLGRALAIRDALRAGLPLPGPCPETAWSVPWWMPGPCPPASRHQKGRRSQKTGASPRSGGARPARSVPKDPHNPSTRSSSISIEMEETRARDARASARRPTSNRQRPPRQASAAATDEAAERTAAPRSTAAAGDASPRRAAAPASAAARCDAGHTAYRRAMEAFRSDLELGGAAPTTNDVDDEWAAALAPDGWRDPNSPWSSPSEAIGWAPELARDAGPRMLAAVRCEPATAALRPSLVDGDGPRAQDMRHGEASTPAV